MLPQLLDALQVGTFLFCFTVTLCHWESPRSGVPPRSEAGLRSPHEDPSRRKIVPPRRDEPGNTEEQFGTEECSQARRAASVGARPAEPKSGAARQATERC